DCDGDAVSPVITLTPSTLITASTRPGVVLQKRIEYSCPGVPTTQLRPAFGYTGRTWPSLRLTMSRLPRRPTAAAGPAAKAVASASASALTVSAHLRVFSYGSMFLIFIRVLPIVRDLSISCPDSRVFKRRHGLGGVGGRAVMEMADR